LAQLAQTTKMNCTLIAHIAQRPQTANAFGGTFVFFAIAQTNAKKIQKSHQANAPRETI